MNGWRTGGWKDEWNDGRMDNGGINGWKIGKIDDK